MGNVLSEDDVDDYMKKMGLGNPLSQDKTDERIKQMEAAIIANEKATAQTGPEVRQEKFTRDHLRGISIIYEKFARTASKNLSQKLGVTVNITVASIDQLTVDEFYRSIPIPSTLALISMEPLKTGAVFEIDPSITFAIIDIICGRKAGTTKPCRELTDDEEKLIKGIYAILLEDIKQAWVDVSDVPSVELRPRLEKIEPDPKLIKLAPPSEMTALLDNIGSKD